MIYTALLGGINVGGHRVKMEHLRELFREIGLTNVRSYIQTGNVFFEAASTDRRALSATIEAHLREALGYDVPVLLRTTEELEQILALNPFQHLHVTDDIRRCVMFLAEPPPDGLRLPLRAPKNDLEIVAATPGEVFIVWYLINGRPPSSSAEQFTVKTLGRIKATTRFFHTVAKILAAAKQG